MSGENCGADDEDVGVESEGIGAGRSDEGFAEFAHCGQDNCKVLGEAVFYIEGMDSGICH